MLNQLNQANTEVKKMRVETNKYFASHGKNPKGFGGWWFEFLMGGIDFMQFEFTGSYTDAKKAAVAKARANGATVVRVLP